MAHHAEIRAQNGSLYLVDLGTPSGTFLGGRRLDPQQPQPLRHGDAVVVGGPGGPEFRVEIVAALNAPDRAGPPQGPSSGRVDLATAQRMVEDAVLQATRREDKA